MTDLGPIIKWPPNLMQMNDQLQTGGYELDNVQMAVIRDYILKLQKQVASQETSVKLTPEQINAIKWPDLQTTWDEGPLLNPRAPDMHQMKQDIALWAINYALTDLK